ncbi:MAG: DUF4230 domain-containing protein [Clostridia bacterium]|nr:DUF4230 domain-containing protein [Clostridia bacterium]
MKKIGRWLAGIAASALTMVLVLALLPYASRLLARIMPDESGAAIKASAIISSRLETSARLETLSVAEEGVLNYDIQAAFIGSVANVNVRYVYTGSFGIDLSEVTMQVTGDEIIFTLPAPGLISDSLDPQEVYRNNEWYPYFDDNDYQQLLTDERLACRERYLSGEHAQALWHATTKAMDQTIAQWIADVQGQVQFTYRMAEQASP